MDRGDLPIWIDGHTEGVTWTLTRTVTSILTDLSSWETTCWLSWGNELWSLRKGRVRTGCTSPSPTKPQSCSLPKPVSGPRHVAPMGHDKRTYRCIWLGPLTLETTGSRSSKNGVQTEPKVDVFYSVLFFRLWVVIGSLVSLSKVKGGLTCI